MMAVLTFPNLTPSTATFGMTSNTKRHTSPLSKTIQTVEYPGARWALSITFNNLTYDDARIMKAFLAQCRGQGGRFYYGDPAFLVNGPAGIATGTPVVSGASQTGGTLVTTGWTASQTGIIKAGDYAHWDNSVGGRELHMITADANSGAGAGAATLSIEPPIRVSPDDAAAITVTSAMTQFMLQSDDSSWATRPPLTSNVSIQAIEAFTDAA